MSDMAHQCGQTGDAANVAYGLLRRVLSRLLHVLCFRQNNTFQLLGQVAKCFERNQNKLK